MINFEENSRILNILMKNQQNIKNSIYGIYILSLLINILVLNTKNNIINKSSNQV